MRHRTTASPALSGTSAPATAISLWQFGLPSENGGFQVLYSRPRFAPNGHTAYFGTFISAPDSPDQYANLYAVDTSGLAPTPRRHTTLAR